LTTRASGSAPSLHDLLQSLLRPELVADGPGQTNPLRLGCLVEPPASEADILAAWPEPASVPAELRELWLMTGGARLFEDVEYGQWGLELLSPKASASRTVEGRSSYLSEDLRPDDVVFGEFIGDQEVLVYAPSESSSRRILVAIPLDGRDEWPAAETTVTEFLVRYRAARGKQYWSKA
jgi:hypothetical protein